MKSLIISLVVVLSFIEIADAQETVKSTTTNYIRVEVRGTLHKESYYWYLETEDVFQSKAKVILLRSEDKDHALDEFLDEHLDQEMVARGLLDTRRIITDSFTMYIVFGGRSNIWTADADVPANTPQSNARTSVQR